MRLKEPLAYIFPGASLIAHPSVRVDVQWPIAVSNRKDVNPVQLEEVRGDEPLKVVSTER